MMQCFGMHVHVRVHVLPRDMGRIQQLSQDSRHLSFTSVISRMTVFGPDIYIALTGLVTDLYSIIKVSI